MASRLAVAVAIGLAHASPAFAETRAGLSAAEMFREAENAATDGHVEDAEALFRALTHDPALDIRSEAHFRLGLLFERLKRYQSAGIEFRALLDEQPNAARVRLELAKVLALIGDEAGARRALRQAQASGLPADVAVLVDQYANALRSRKPIGASLEFALLPDSNINRATDAKTLDTVIAPLNLSDDARARSGLGLKLSGQVYARLPLSASLSVLPRASVEAELYGAGEFNDISTSGLLGLEWRSGPNRVSPAAGATYRYYGGRLYARTASVKLDWTRALGRKAQLVSDVSINRVDYVRNHMQTGDLYSVALNYERAFTATDGGSIGINTSRQTARDAGYALASGGASLLYWHDFGRITLFGSLLVQRLEADARLFLFPERRKEWLYRASGGATFRQAQVAGFAPLVRVALERNASTVGLYDFRRIGLELGLTRAF